MAWVEQHGNRFHVAFRIGERRFKKTLRTGDRRAADAMAQRIDQRLHLIESGEVVLPDGADLVTYLFSDGRVERPVALEETLGRPLATTMDEYLESVSSGSIESNTLLTLKIHLKHVVDVLGRKFMLDRLSFADLQRYVDVRTREKGRRGKPLSPTTIRKELVSFGAVWPWALRMGYVKQAFPKQGLRFPKVDEKPAFQTFAEIQAQIARGGQ